LFAFADDNLIDQDTALKITTGFGGGIAKEGQVCGAFTAGVMLLGLRHGQGVKDSKEKKDNTYNKVRKFIDEFNSKNNSILCKEILNGIDLKSEDGINTFKEKNYSENVCLKCVISSIEILQKFI
jgi:C_GCAxxG_C_C family probable redox protein